jgi:hypothetical protein
MAVLSYTPCPLYPREAGSMLSGPPLLFVPSGSTVTMLTEVGHILAIVLVGK